MLNSFQNKEVSWLDKKHIGIALDSGGECGLAHIGVVKALEENRIPNSVFQLNTGLGYYNVRSTSTVFNSTIESSEWDFGYMISLGYSYPINSTFKFGAEIKWNNISEVQITNLSLQIKLHMLLWLL